MSKIGPSSQRSFRGVAPAARIQQRRDQLIEAGIEAFGRRGFHATTVRDICTGAKLTERYFYESFSGLDALFAAILQQLNVELKDATLRVIASPYSEPLGLAEAALRVFFEYVRDDPRRARIMLIDAVSIGHDARRIAADATLGYMHLLREFIDALFPQAAAQGLDTDIVATGLIGANVHIATRWVRERFATPLEQVLANTLVLYRALIAQVGGSGATPGRAKRTTPG